ncbi:hypothetical protein ACHAXR_012092 [Thalassiosira sp. AJA248-18]
MVEGPGCTRNGRKVQVVVGKTLVDTGPWAGAGSNISGTSSSHECLAPQTLPHHLAGELASYTLEQAFSLGKELFLIFTGAPPDGLHDASYTDVALRLHFGMNGSLTTRKVKSNDVQKKPSGIAPWKQKNDPSLRLYFVDSASSYVIVEAWDTTVTFPVSAMNSRTKLMDLTSRDACSALFNAQDVFTSIRESGKNLIISDALLNQCLFPGVGNIIKIESLHRAKIDPRRIVSSLTDAELRRLIRHSRAFSMNWLKSGRAGSKLVYNQTACGTCQGMTVKMQKIGGASSDDSGNGSGNGHAYMSRVTFWCTVCQPNVIAEDARSTQPSSDSTTNTIGTEKATNNTATTTNAPQAQCPQHGRKSMKLCRVRKGNQNTLRIFFTCKCKGCQYFQWADSQFPPCRCGKKAILRVSKTERSGGRWFLCCASGGDKSSKGSGSNGCGHFEWAKDDQLAPLRSLITPLL